MLSVQYCFEHNFRNAIFLTYFDQKYTYSTTSENSINLVKIIKIHGNDQSGWPLGHCVRCVFWQAWFCMSLNIRPALWESTHCDKMYLKKKKKHKMQQGKQETSVLWLKGYCLTKIFLCFFPKSFISWNHKLNWLAQTWHCMDFFSWDAIFKACGVFFIFWIYHNCPGLRPRKSITFTKNHFFHFCLVFSILLRVSTMLTNFLNVCKMRFSGSRVSKFGKIHGSESGAQTNLLSRTLLVFNHLGGKWKINFPPRVSKNGGGNKNFPPRVPKYGGEIKIFPGGKNLIFSPEESEIPKNFRLRRAIFQKQSLCMVL